MAPQNVCTMLRPLSLLLLVLSSLSPVRADNAWLDPNQDCVEGIVEVYGEIPFDGDTGDYYVDLCTNPLKLITVYAAALTYCTADEIDAGFKLRGGYCSQYGLVEQVPMSEFAANLTPEAIKQMPIIEYTGEEPTENITAPAIISQEWYELSFLTVSIWDFQMWTHWHYGFANYGFWGIILVIGMVTRVITLVSEARLRRTGRDVEGSSRRSSKLSNPLARPYFWVQKHVVVPSIFGSYHRQLYWWCTVPTRGEAFVVYSFWIVSFILGAVNYRAFYGNLYWAGINVQVWRYMADRTGIMSYSNLVLVWMFSGRNNIFVWATGWSFATFNVFHKHVARVATLQAIMHSIGYTVHYFVAGYEEYYKEDFAETWWYMGVVATIVMSFLVLFSFPWFRVKLYESFLIIHIVLSIVTLVGLFYHTSIFDGQYDVYLWPPTAIWCFDRFLRLVRQVYCNLHVAFSKKGALHRTRGAVSFDADTNIVTLGVTPASRLSPRAGQHYYLYQPFTIRGWENHPFTLGYWEQTPENQTRLVFWIKPCDGWTKQLKERALKAASQPVPTTILLEGPYGLQEPLWAYDDVLLIAGGSGIAAVVPYLIEHVRRATSTDAKNTTLTRSITVVWTDKSDAFIRRLAAHELSTALARSDVTASFYSTGSAGVTPRSSASISEASSPTDASPTLSKALEAGALEKETMTARVLSGGNGVSVRSGRPDLAALVAQSATNAREAGSRLAVFVCGPPRMADAVRAATGRAMRDATVPGSVEYFEESYGW